MVPPYNQKRYTGGQKIYKLSRKFIVFQNIMSVSIQYQQISKSNHEVIQLTLYDNSCPVLEAKPLPNRT